eukprot:scaffold2282_cov136-Skeletonema_marinoi.AAC.2
MESVTTKGCAEGVVISLWSSRIDHPGESIYTRVMGLLDTQKSMYPTSTHTAACGRIKGCHRGGSMVPMHQSDICVYVD